MRILASRAKNLFSSLQQVKGDEKCLCGFANEFFFSLSLPKGKKIEVAGVPDRMGMHGGEKARFNLTGLGCGDIISEQMTQHEAPLAPLLPSP